jgi:hypothetical protein
MATRPAGRERLLRRALVLRIPAWALILAGVLVLLAAAGGIWAYNHYVPASSGPVDADPGGDESPPAEVSIAGQAKLLKRYAPVLVLASNENWRPVRVRRFVADACASRLAAGRWTQCNRRGELDVNKLPRGSGWRLDVPHCATPEGPECYQHDAPIHRRAPAVVYGRFWRNETGADRHVGYVLQYWLFYYFNDWQDSMREPTLWQFHEGDWEEVSVGLARDGTPAYVATSRHCTGSFRFWDPKQIEIREESHPTVYVARGSHANHFAVERPPSPPKCFGPLRRLLRTLRIKPHDITGIGTVLGSGSDPIVVIPVSRVGWLAFQGSWGEGDFVRWVARDRTRHSRRHGESPTGPVQQGMRWSNPVFVHLHRWSLERTPPTGS